MILKSGQSWKKVVKTVNSIKDKFVLLKMSSVLFVKVLKVEEPIKLSFSEYAVFYKCCKYLPLSN